MQTLNLLEEAKRCDSREYFPLKLRQQTVGSMDILQGIVFRLEDRLPFFHSTESERK